MNKKTLAIIITTAEAMIIALKEILFHKKGT